MKPTKKVEDRIKGNVVKFQKVLAMAKDKDLNESDTVSIINDMLADVFGYEKYKEITSELMIRGTYCDLAIRLDDSFEKGFLIECKRVGCDLKEEHMRQAVNYGVNKGIQWVVLTNGLDWRLYRLRFEQPVTWDLVLRFDLGRVDTKNEQDLEKVFCLTKEGVAKGAREEIFDKVQCVNRFVIGQLVLQEPVLSLIRREIRKMSDGVAVEEVEIANILRTGVFKRDIVDEEQGEVQTAIQRVNKFYRHNGKKAATKKEDESKHEPLGAASAVEVSLTESLLAEAESSQASPVVDQSLS